MSAEKEVAMKLFAELRQAGHLSTLKFTKGSRWEGLEGGGGLLCREAPKGRERYLASPRGRKGGPIKRSAQ